MDEHRKFLIHLMDKLQSNLNDPHILEIYNKAFDAYLETQEMPIVGYVFGTIIIVFVIGMLGLLASFFLHGIYKEFFDRS